MAEASPPEEGTISILEPLGAANATACKDYEEKKFCPRGTLCPYHHNYSKVTASGLHETLSATIRHLSTVEILLSRALKAAPLQPPAGPPTAGRGDYHYRGRGTSGRPGSGYRGKNFIPGFQQGHRGYRQPTPFYVGNPVRQVSPPTYPECYSDPSQIYNVGSEYAPAWDSGQEGFGQS